MSADSPPAQNEQDDSRNETLKSRQKCGRLIVASIIFLSIVLLGVLTGIYVSNPVHNSEFLYGVITVTILLLLLICQLVLPPVFRYLKACFVSV